MRMLIVIPMAVLVVAGVGAGIGAAMGSVHAREMLLAGVACLVAAELSQVPMILSRGGNPLVLSQAGLVASMVHLFVGISIAGGMMLMGVATGTVFIAWLMAFYLTTLAVIVVGIVQAIRRSPARPAAHS